MMHFWYLFSLTFGIGTVDGWSIVVLKKCTVSLNVFYFEHLVLLIERYGQRYEQVNDIYNSDLRGTHPFRFLSWVFPLEYIEDKWLVNCGDFPGDFRSFHGVRLDFICSEDKEGLFEVIDDTSISTEVVLFKWLALISLIVFSNVGPGSNFSTSKLLFIVSCSGFLSNKVNTDILMAAEAIIFRWLSVISLIVFQMLVQVIIFLLQCCFSYLYVSNSCQTKW